MISVEEARQLVMSNINPGVCVEKGIEASHGYYVAEDITCPVDSPPFDNSAMDGYAFRFSDHELNKEILVIGELAAGANYRKALLAGEATRIFTGAMIPEGADTVVMQEKINLAGTRLMIQDPQLKKGANIRKAGSQNHKGDTAILKGTKINAATIGFLASMGFSKIKVYDKPRVAIIITGDELMDAGQDLIPGHIYESNAATLKPALISLGVHSILYARMPDDEMKITEAIRTMIPLSDMILVSGGISVGDYDFTARALANNGVNTIFYKVKQKPGKPVLFGKKDDKVFFALPGNPASVMNCFYNFVLPAINRMQNAGECFLKSVRLPLKSDCVKKPGLSVFLKAKLDKDKVVLLDGQESYKMNSFAHADCLVYLPEQQGSLSAGEIVEVIVLPY
jgi:molybdopterin molybdotransferase